jgi:hypothetical protein
MPPTGGKRVPLGLAIAPSHEVRPQPADLTFGLN